MSIRITSNMLLLIIPVHMEYKLGEQEKNVYLFPVFLLCLPSPLLLYGWSDMVVSFSRVEFQKRYILNRLLSFLLTLL